VTELPQTAGQAVLPDEQGAALHRRRRLVVNSFAVVIGLVFLAGLLNLPGVRSTTARSRAGELELAVVHGQVSRGGLATPFDITVSRPGGFAAPVVVGVTRDYLSIFDENGLDPDPASATTMGEWLLWEFEPPIGDTLEISFDARIEPAVQRGKSGDVAVFDGGREVVAVHLRTTVLP
jgi:hypothetical protein